MGMERGGHWRVGGVEVDELDCGHYLMAARSMNMACPGMVGRVVDGMTGWRVELCDLLCQFSQRVGGIAKQSLPLDLLRRTGKSTGGTQTRSLL